MPRRASWYLLPTFVCLLLCAPTQAWAQTCGDDTGGDPLNDLIEMFQDFFGLSSGDAETQHFGTVEDLILALLAEETCDGFREAVGELFDPMNMDQSHDAMEAIREAGLQRELLEALLLDEDGNPTDSELLDAVEALMNTGNLDFYIDAFARNSFQFFDPATDETASDDNHFDPGRDGVFLNTDLWDGVDAELETVAHEWFHAYNDLHGDIDGALNEGFAMAIGQWALGTDSYNLAEKIYGTKNWKRDLNGDGDYALGDAAVADGELREILEAIAERDISDIAWDDATRLASDYRDFWEGQNRFPDADWWPFVDEATADMLKAHAAEDNRYPSGTPTPSATPTPESESWAPVPDPEPVPTPSPTATPTATPSP